MTLQARAGAFNLNAAFSVPASGITGVFGASGSGKSTLLRSIAGLHRGAGSVRLGAEAWQDDATGAFVPPHERGVGFVSQEADLFPHLTVRENLRYGYERSRHGAPRDWEDVVAATGVQPLLSRYPAGLSGGERQRVAIARALLSAPRLMLMDEPVSALDETARHEIFPCIKQVAGRFGVPVLYVTHSAREVVRLAGRIIWMSDGSVRTTRSVNDAAADPEFSRWLV